MTCCTRDPAIGKRQLLACDVLDAPLEPESVDTVLAPYSFLQVVDEDAVGPLLERVHTWLKPGGRFVTDTFSPYLIPFRRPGLEANIRRIGAETRIAIYIAYDHLKRHMRELALVQQDGREQVLEMHLNYYFPHELRAAFEAGGFESVGITGGYRGSH